MTEQFNKASELPTTIGGSSNGGGNHANTNKNNGNDMANGNNNQGKRGKGRRGKGNGNGYDSAAYIDQARKLYTMLRARDVFENNCGDNCVENLIMAATYTTEEELARVKDGKFPTGNSFEDVVQLIIFVDLLLRLVL
jgi:hypothetical protein